MLRPIIDSPQAEFFSPDVELKTSNDGKSAEVVPAEKQSFPPLNAMEVDNLLANGVSLNPVSNFIHASDTDNLDMLDNIASKIDVNEIHEF